MNGTRLNPARSSVSPCRREKREHVDQYIARTANGGFDISRRHCAQHLVKVAKDQGILLMIHDQCAVRRNLAEGTLEQCGKGDVTAKGTVADAQADCFPQLYAALVPSAPDFVITL